MQDKILKNDEDIVERAYLLKCSINPSLLRVEIKPEFFTIETYKNIYTKLIDNKRNGINTDLSLLYLSFPIDSNERILLATFNDDQIPDALIDQYVDQIKENFRRRVAMEALNETYIQRGHHDPYYFQEVLKDKLALISPEESIHDSKRITKQISNYFEQQTENGAKISGVHTGFTQFNQIFNGFQKSKLYVLAARPSMGKSALMLNLAVNACKSGHYVYIHALEESINSLSCRMISNLTGLDNEQVQRGLFKDWEPVTQALNEISQFNLFINDKANISAIEVCEAIRAQHFKQKLDIVFIDHIQDLKHGKDSWHQSISEACAMFKGLAKDLQIPVVIISQLNRGVEQRSDKHPMLSDLKESGDVEQKADAVIFIYRDDYYNPQTALPGLVDITIAKNRDGRIGTFNLHWNGSQMKFHD